MHELTCFFNELNLQTITALLNVNVNISEQIKEIVIGDKHIPVQFQLSESHFFSFITINNTYWIVSSNNFTNITVEDFEG